MSKLAQIPALFRLIFWSIIPIVLLLLPANFFDKGQSICLSVLLLDKTCPACGLTRATQHALHMDFETAWHYNKLIVIVLPLLFYLWLKELAGTYKSHKSQASKAKR